MSLRLSEADIAVLRKDGVRISSVNGKPMNSLANISPEVAYLSTIEKHLGLILSALSKQSPTPSNGLKPIDSRLQRIADVLEEQFGALGSLPDAIKELIPKKAHEPIKEWEFATENDATTGRLKRVTALSSDREWVFDLVRDDGIVLSKIKARMSYDKNSEQKTEWDFTIRHDLDGKLSGMKAVKKTNT